MPATQRNPKSRTLITVALLLFVAGFLVSLFVMGQTAGGRKAARSAQTTPAAQADTDTGAGGAATDPPPPADDPAGDPGDDQPPADPPPTDPPAAEPEPAQPAATPTAAADTTPAYRARVWEGAAAPSPIGGLDAAAGDRSRLAFTLAGAGVSSVQLADYFETIEQAIAGRANPAAASGHYELQRSTRAGDAALISLAARGMMIDGAWVDLFASNGMPVWREAAPGRFVAEVVDDSTGEVALRITRAYEPRAGSFGFDVRQSIENLTGRPLRCKWFQYGPVDLNEDPSGYRIPTRRVRFGYLLDPARDLSRQYVQADSKLTEHRKVLDWIASANGPKLVWPDPKRYERAHTLSWIAQTSRYFAFVVHPLIDAQAAGANAQDPTANPVDKKLGLASEVYALALDQGGDPHVVLQLNSPEFTIAAGGTEDLGFGAYAGPLSRKVMTSADEPVSRSLSLDRMVIYQIGWCGFCTFQWIAKPLLSLLQLFHDYLVFDWALAIILLVCCVRLALHPIFKRSQVSMLRFSKQMQNLAPKQKKLQEKYKDDPQRMRTEMVKLMREENVNYAGLLGCLPMLLQSPIWIALYAMLYFAFELRHEPAFFGVFQALTANNWLFLADLSRPDQMIPLGGMYHVPVLSTLMGSFSGINLLPLLLGFVFFVHQKYLTPPTASTLSPEQQQQQKIIKVMMVVMFPVIMYNAPSGLTLYFVTNSTLAIVEGRHIRAHVDRLDLEEPDKPKHGELGRKKVPNKATPKPKRDGGGKSRPKRS